MVGKNKTAAIINLVTSAAANRKKQWLSDSG